MDVWHCRTSYWSMLASPPCFEVYQLFVFGRPDCILSQACYHSRSDLWPSREHTLVQTHTYRVTKIKPLLLLSLNSRPSNSPTHATSADISLFFDCCRLLFFSFLGPLLPFTPPLLCLSVCLTPSIAPTSVVGSLSGTVHIPGWKICSFVQTPASKICPEKSHMALSILWTSPLWFPPPSPTFSSLYFSTANHPSPQPTSTHYPCVS